MVRRRRTSRWCSVLRPAPSRRTCYACSTRRDAAARRRSSSSPPRCLSQCKSAQELLDNCCDNLISTARNSPAPKSISDEPDAGVQAGVPGACRITSGPLLLYDGSHDEPNKHLAAQTDPLAAVIVTEEPR